MKQVINKNNQIVGWAVCYVPTQQGKLYAGLKTETIAAFHSQHDAMEYCASEQQGGYIDEMHIGYRVYPMHWKPKGVVLK
jgi:hypothetical protein